MRQQKKKKEFNDLLIPILLIILLLPFITRLIVYDAGLSQYLWYSDNKVTYDFFSYYKSATFIFLSIISAFILIPYMLIKRDNLKDMKPFILIGLYSLFTIISTVLSVNFHASTVGGMTHFENIFVLIGYVIMLIYTYQIEKNEFDYLCILRVMEFTLALMCVIGLLQMLGQDLLYKEWMQKMIIPQEFWKDYLGRIKSMVSNNAVSLTLFNPNYACVYIAMVIPLLLALTMPLAKIKGSSKASNLIGMKERIFCFILSLVLLVLLFKTYSRSGLVALLISLIALLYFFRNYLRKYLIQSLIAGIACIVLFVGIDCINGFRYTNKIIGTFLSFQDNDSNKLQEIITNKDDVTFRFKDKTISLALSKNSDKKTTLIFKNGEGKDISSSYDTTTQCLNYSPFSGIKFYTKTTGEESYIYCKFNRTTWRFIHSENQGYAYVNDYGKLDQLTTIEHIGSQSMEDIGSGRGYIWSRSIPLLKNTLIIGKGPDTFLYVFPQSDYVGKANNCKTAYTLIEKPHSLYLMTAIHTGVISLIILIAFYLIYMISSIRIYRQNDLSTLQARMGLGCFIATLSFMVSGFFNDSSLQTTPLFIVMLGLGMDINNKLRKQPME